MENIKKHTKWNHQCITEIRDGKHLKNTQNGTTNALRKFGMENIKKNTQNGTTNALRKFGLENI